MWITPNYQDTDFSWPLGLEDKITIFLDRTLGWQLDIANQCINGKKTPDGATLRSPIPHSGFAVLNIVLSYFEMIAKYQMGYKGTGKSEYYFKQGVYLVFPHLKTESPEVVDSLLDVLYFGGRCGLYHGGMTDHRIILTGDTDFPMLFDPHESRLKINPRLLVPALIAHLNDYGKKIQDATNSKLRRNFEKRFDFDALKCAASGTKNSGLKPRQLVTVLPDILYPNLKVVFCGAAGEVRSVERGVYYADSRNRFWAVLFRVGLVPRAVSPHEFRNLPKYGVGFTELVPKYPVSGNPSSASEFDICGFRSKIEKFTPKAVAFNGKRYAQIFYGHSVHYGRQPEPIGRSAAFVLPSTSGNNRRYWNEAHWRELAVFVGCGG